jgi:hypothetical protein
MGRWERSMNEAIELLLIQIATMCLHITAQGQFLADCDLTGHTTTVYVCIRKPDSDFTSSESIKAGVILRVDAPYDLQRRDWQPPAEQQAQCEQELQAVINQLQPYLHTEQQEAA